MEKREKASLRELEVLKAVGLNGWMTARTVALWVWASSPYGSALNRAYIVLKRLEAKKELLRRETMQGIAIYVLSTKGADRVNQNLLNEGYERGWAHHGYDLGFCGFRSGLLAMEYLAKKLQDPNTLGAIGKAGLRAKIVEGYDGCDGVYIKKNGNDYTVVGVLVVTNAREGIQAKLKRLTAQRIKLDLVGEARIITTLRKRTTV